MINREDQDMMNQFRNKFSHNQYPPKSVCGFAVDKHKDDKIAAQLAKAAIEIYENTVKKMNTST